MLTKADFIVIWSKHNNLQFSLKVHKSFPNQGNLSALIICKSDVSFSTKSARATDL